MRRKQLKVLEDWRNAADRKPLIVRGARQVGKSTLVRLFAAQHHSPLIEVNLERHPSMSAVFESMSPLTILEQIEALPSMPAVAIDLEARRYPARQRRRHRRAVRGTALARRAGGCFVS